MRDIKIDFLRFLGLSLIILAHVDPPSWLAQLRNFDVVLMVVVSGLAFTQSRKAESYQSYLWKRIKRLLFPVWLFLSFYFLANTGLSLLGKTALIPLEVILDSYTLTEGIGYVWIIRVFLLVALTAPFISIANQRVKDHRAYFSILIFSYLLYELLLALTSRYTTNSLGENVSLFVYYGIAFSLVFAIGIRLPQLRKAECLILAGFFLLTFAVLGITYLTQQGELVTTQTRKYPPSAYYFSYAMGMTVLAYLVADKCIPIIRNFKKLEFWILFIAQNSMWIYLWHIPIVEFFEQNSYFNFLIEYFVAYSGATLITFFQVSAVKKWLLPTIKQESLKKDLTILLTG
ncbi:acyltransferase family protein [Chroococcidiopsis sp.]|uniref:acyltransferase family protein n=1 Tax=Chroococcidiopsis sp. TaxID=3088168 RepID=UPI003F41067C